MKILAASVESALEHILSSPLSITTSLSCLVKKHAPPLEEETLNAE